MSTISLLTWPAIAGTGVTATRGGVSEGPYESLNLSLAVGDDPERVRQNRDLLASALDASPADFVFARQVHSDGVHVVTAGDRGRGTFDPETAPEADALFSAAGRRVEDELMGSLTSGTSLPSRTGLVRFAGQIPGCTPWPAPWPAIGRRSTICAVA